MLPVLTAVLDAVKDEDERKLVKAAVTALRNGFPSRGVTSNKDMVRAAAPGVPSLLAKALACT